ncbi:MAG: Ig-like domain-containing protein [Prevotella sp.]|nr:Ig-like domain-containing protein [Prevotella sp.]
MANSRSNERIRYRYGICLNDNCEKCKSKEVQEIPARKDFVCQNPGCGKPLRECPPPKKGGNKKLIGIIAGVVALLAIIGSVIAFTGGSPKIESLSLDKAKVTFKPGQAETLNVAIEPNDAQAELIWQSSDDKVVTVKDGVITAKNVGKASIKVFVKGQEDVIAECECNVIEENVDMQTLDIQEDPLVLRPGGHQQLTVKFTPEDQNETISWSSSDESIATVSPKGKVEAIKVGAVSIIAKSDRTGIADTAFVSVEGPAEMPKEEVADSKSTTTKPASVPASKPAPAPKPAASSGSKNLGYATFKGTWPNDVNGRMVFKTSHVIDSRDPKGRVAEAGDYVIGEWSEGHLVQGIWYGSDNQVKGSVIIGK